MDKDLKIKLKQLERENKMLKEEIEKLQKDHLTNAYNRNYLDKIIEEEYLIKLQKCNNWFYNVYLIDLNDLHTINRRDGYEVGDKYIKETIEYIKKIFDKKNASYRIYRIGGDEFLIISQPYDFIEIEKLKSNNYEIAHVYWDKKQTFDSILKKLDTLIIKQKNKKKKYKPCRDCILRKHPDVLDIVNQYLENLNESKNDL